MARVSALEAAEHHRPYITATLAEQLPQRLRASEVAVPAVVPQKTIREILDDLGSVESDVDVRPS